MKNTLTFMLAAALLASAGIAFAYPTLTGPTGQAVIPTAEIAGMGLTLAADWMELDELRLDVPSVGTLAAGTDTAVPIRGIISFGNDAEFGAMYDPFDDKGILKKALGAHAKARMGQILTGEAALGAQYRREDLITNRRLEYTQGYFVWTTDFDPNDWADTSFAITAGLNWTQRKSGDFSADGFRGFAGLRFDLAQSISLLAEYQTKQAEVGDQKPITAAAVRLTPNSNISLQVGVTNAFGFIGTDKHRMFAGINFGVAPSLNQ